MNRAIVPKRPLGLNRLDLDINNVEVECNAAWMSVNNLFDVRITRERSNGATQVRVALFTYDLNHRVAEMVVDEQEFVRLVARKA